MGFWSDAWDVAKKIGLGVVDVFVGIAEVLLTTVYAIGYAIFSIINHLYDWIDKIANRSNRITTVTMVPPTDTEIFINDLRNKGRTILAPYSAGKRSLIVAQDGNGKVILGQVAETNMGFESKIEEAFKKGHLIEQPVEA